MTTQRKAIITGVSGQDGAYLTKLLLGKGYQVTGTYRRTSSVNFWRMEELGVLDHPNLKLVEHDLTDLGSTLRLLESAQADELYNLAAQPVRRVEAVRALDHGQLSRVLRDLRDERHSVQSRIAAARPRIRHAQD